jgi:Domain of unknown function (DUF4258)
MARVTIQRLRDFIRSLDYSVSVHAAEELEDDGLSILDLEAIILGGIIVERQRDRATGETKFIIRGDTLAQGEAECVVKIGPSGRPHIITIYLD